MTNSTRTTKDPHADHIPRIRKVPLGHSELTGRQHYGTSVRCSCGMIGSRVSNNPPSSREAKIAIERAYQDHLASEGVA